MRKAVPEACLLLLLPQSYGPRFRGRSRSYLITLGLQLFCLKSGPNLDYCLPYGGGGLGGLHLPGGGRRSARGTRPGSRPSFPDGLTYGAEGATKRSVLLPSSQGLSGPLPPLVRAGAGAGPAGAGSGHPRATASPGTGRHTHRLSEEGGELPVSSGSGTPAPPARVGQAGLSGHGLCERA